MLRILKDFLELHDLLSFPFRWTFSAAFWAENHVSVDANQYEDDFTAAHIPLELHILCRTTQRKAVPQNVDTYRWWRMTSPAVDTARTRCSPAEPRRRALTTCSEGVHMTSISLPDSRTSDTSCVTAASRLSVHDCITSTPYRDIVYTPTSLIAIIACLADVIAPIV